MRFDKTTQWVGAVYADDLGLMREMLDEDPSLANSHHEAFDDPFRKKRFPVGSAVMSAALPSTTKSCVARRA